MKVRVIKAYQKLTQSMGNAGEVDLFSDRAIADFRGFQCVATLHTERVHNTDALDIMEEVLESLSSDIKKRRLQML